MVSRARRRAERAHSSRGAGAPGTASGAEGADGAPQTGPSRGHHLVQANIAVAVGAPDSAEMRGFFDGLELVNRRAREADGFVGMLGEDGGGGSGDLIPPDWYLNVSVWEDLETFRAFVYAGDHLSYLRRAREWYGRAHATTRAAAPDARTRVARPPTAEGDESSTHTSAQ